MGPRFRYRFSPAEPLVRVGSGSTVDARFPDSDGLGSDLTPLLDAWFEGHCSTTGNPVYGPIAVEGARPGESLRVDILRVNPDRAIARTLLAPGHGFLPDGMLSPGREKPRHLYQWKVEEGWAELVNPLGGGERPLRNVRVRTRPFLGCIATGSPSAPSSLLAHAHGGNLDLPDLGEGATLWLPVLLPGALLYVGDLHAAQGDGETAGGGLEISGSTTMRLTRCEHPFLPGLHYGTAEGMGTIGVASGFEPAAQAAQAALIQWFGTLGWNRCDAQMLVSQTCRFRPGGMTRDYCVVACFVAYDRAGLSRGLIGL